MPIRHGDLLGRRIVLEELKRAAITAFTETGIDRFALRLHARDALVLAYHAIVNQEKEEPFRYYHTVDEFEAHLDWLGTYCTPVGLHDFARWKRGDLQTSKPPVLVTFDDGYRNNATLAAPLLNRKGFPALFFITSGYLESSRVLWPDEVFSRVLAWPWTSLRAPDGRIHVLAPGQQARAAVALTLVEACKNCTDAHRRAFVAYLEKETPQCNPLQDPISQEFMNWNDVRALSAAGFDIGSHTVTHAILSSLEPEALWDELIESRGTIEAHTGLPCTTLAYPNGRSRDIANRVLAATTEAGYDLAFTVSNRWCSRTRDNLRLDRVAPPGHSDSATFALHASGCRQWFPH